MPKGEGHRDAWNLFRRQVSACAQCYHVKMTHTSTVLNSPAHRRNIIHSPCEPFVRLSFGPPLEDLDRGLDGIERVLAKAREGHPMGSNYKRSSKGVSVNPPAAGS